MSKALYEGLEGYNGSAWVMTSANARAQTERHSNRIPGSRVPCLQCFEASMANEENEGIIPCSRHSHVSRVDGLPSRRHHPSCLV